MIIVLTVIIAGVVVLVTIIRALTGRRDAQRYSQEEELQFRQLMATLQKMEDRVVNLETILMQRQGQAEFRPSDEERR
jgi:phage shock protein B